MKVRCLCKKYLYTKGKDIVHCRNCGITWQVETI